MQKYDILYELASLYKIQNNLADYEKTLLLIVSDDENFWTSIKMLQIEYLQSIGVKYDKDLDELMKEVYNL